VLESGFPHWRKLKAWRRERPDFSAQLDAAIAFAAGRQRGRKWLRFDQAAADRILVRVWSGERLRDVAGLRSRLPCLAIIARWRRENAEFDGALREALVMGRKRQGRARRRLDEAVTGAVIDAICEGASLKDLARRPDMPCAYTLHAWLRDDAAFCKAVAWASGVRDEGLLGQAVEIAGAMTGADLAGAQAKIAAIQGRIRRMAPRGGRRAWSAQGAKER
jgi:hypothetical protein